jgi:hypothetical protein
VYLFYFTRKEKQVVQKNKRITSYTQSSRQVKFFQTRMTSRNYVRIAFDKYSWDITKPSSEIKLKY